MSNEKIMAALKKFEETGETPEKYDENNSEHTDLEKEIVDLSQRAHKIIDRLETFCVAWDRK